MTNQDLYNQTYRAVWEQYVDAIGANLERNNIIVGALNDRLKNWEQPDYRKQLDKEFNLMFGRDR